MDHEDKIRILSNKDKLLAALKRKGAMTNHEARSIGGSRALARITELQHAGEPITVRKLKGSTWEIIYGFRPLGPSAETPRTQKSLF